MHIYPTIFSAALVCFCSICSALRGGVIQEVQTFNSLSHGQIVYASNDSTFPIQSRDFGGFTVSGNSLHDSRDLIVGFDTGLVSTRDSDLEAPFTIGNIENLSDVEFGSSLIIQESGVGTHNNGVISNPDDEGRRLPEGAGSISFDFDQAVEAFGVDLLDVEGPLEEFSFEFFSDGSSVGTVEFEEFLAGGDFFDATAPVEFGNNSANRIVPIEAQEFGVSGFDSVTVNLGGSGALDNVTLLRSSFPIGAVPEPGLATFWMMSGLIGLCGLERRKNRI